MSTSSPPEQPETFREWLFSTIIFPVGLFAFIGLLVFAAVRLDLSEGQGAAFVVGGALTPFALVFTWAWVTGKRRRNR